MLILISQQAVQIFYAAVLLSIETSIDTDAFHGWLCIAVGTVDHREHVDRNNEHFGGAAGSSSRALSAPPID
ncbi:Uncharacterised protein [Mycobacteroides abscessus subsp. bolletii]|nr:Uncharacterised protein [Mycobacteroides abscessus subsp. bolletii]